MLYKLRRKLIIIRNITTPLNERKLNNYGNKNEEIKQ